VQLGLGLFLDQFHHLFHHPVCFFCLFLHISLELFITSDEILFSNPASSNFASVEVLYSSSRSFWSRSSFLNCLFSFSNSAFLCTKASSVETRLTLIFDNQLRFSSFGCILVGMKSVAFLALKHKGVRTQVLRTCIYCKLLSTPFSHS